MVEQTGAELGASRCQSIHCTECSYTMSYILIYVELRMAKLRPWPQHRRSQGFQPFQGSGGTLFVLHWGVVGEWYAYNIL